MPITIPVLIANDVWTVQLAARRACEVMKLPREEAFLLVVEAASAAQGLLENGGGTLHLQAARKRAGRRLEIVAASPPRRATWPPAPRPRPDGRRA